MTPKFRTYEIDTFGRTPRSRDSKRKDKATTLARREVRRTKYEATEAAVRIAANA